MKKSIITSAGIVVTAALSIVACQPVDTAKENNTIKETKLSSAPSLTLEQIYKDKAFKSERIGQIRWLDDGSGYTAIEDSSLEKEKSKNDDATSDEDKNFGQDIVLYDPNTLAKTILVSAAQLTPLGTENPLEIDDYIWSQDRQKLLIYTNSKKVWRSNSRGDYWLYDLSKNKLKQLGQGFDKSQLMFAKFSPNGENVGYVYKNNLYVENITNHSITQLTTDAGNGIINGLFDWVYEEEFQIADGFRWSPDSSKIAYWQLDTNGSKDFTIINNTDELYPTTTTFPYPKVGEVNALANIGIVSIYTPKTRWIDLPNNSRDMYIPRMNWSGNSDEVLIHHLNRKQDTNNLYLANVTSGKLNNILTEKEETFIDYVNDARWFNKGKDFIWISERSGWRHLFRVSRDGKSITNLTDGNFDVTEFKTIDEKNGWLYFMASPEDVSQRYLYRSKLDASVLNQRVTPEKFAGNNRYQMSEDGQWAIHTFSSSNQPPQKYLVQIEGHQEKHRLMENKELVEKLATLNLTDTEFFQVKAQDGLVLDGYIMRPANFDENKKYPIIFYVYGEAWGQTVQDRWRGNSYLYDQLLTQHGFIVASIDNRGTRAPKGKEWRKSIYGAVGVLSSRDQSDALKAMAKQWPYIDTNNVGIWGHSGGGSMTLNMMFRYPEQYHVGVSQAPVADQLLYDTIYQERYSGLLPDYADGYKAGSPITHAKNLKGKLLIVHGTGDDNVHYQGSERLIDELVAHNKQFDFMPYPNRSHSLREGKGTVLHLQTMKMNYFIEHLQH